MQTLITRLVRPLMVLSLWAQRSADAQAIPPIVTVPPLVMFAPDKNIYAKCLVSEPVQIVDHLREIDPAVLRAFHVQVPTESISDRDGPFEATDVHSDESVPSRRLLFAGHVAKFWFILYEHGGYGYHDDLVVFGQQEGRFLDDRGRTPRLCEEGRWPQGIEVGVERR